MSATDSTPESPTDTVDARAIEGMRTCRCGYTVGHKRVRLSGEYNWFGVACYTFGITAVPIAIRFDCRICGETVGRSDDPTDIKRFQGR